jgi:cytochrome bd-type quinol oxidase subunit 2
VSGLVDWLTGLPSFLLFLGLMAVGLLIAAGLSWLSTRAIEDDVRTRTSTSVTTVVGVVAGLYAVLVAFVIVNEWQTFNDAQATVSAESSALATAYFDAGVLPEPTRSELQAIISYDRSVICDEIPYLADHQGPSLKTRAAMQQLYETADHAPPAVQASPFFANLVTQIAEVSTARHDRISAAGSPLPQLLLVVILATSLALVAVASVLDTQHRRWHLILTTALTILVALNLALVITLNRPFDGAAKISDTPLREGVPAAVLRCDTPR